MTKNISKQIRQIPSKPGVYLLRDKTGRLLYIGKAQDLKKRMQTHFTKKTDFFTGQFIGKVADIDWIKTDDEKQAILLENQLIKKYQPRYNIQWRDDKSYFFVTFTKDEWPRVEVVHQTKIKNKKLKIKNTNVKTKKYQLEADSIGPFINGRELRKILRALRKIIPYRACKNPYEKPCLAWHLGLCPAHSPICHSGESRNPDLKPGSRVKPRMTNRLDIYLQSLKTLSQILRLYAGEKIRIEAYDISNIQGRYATGSMIVFYGNQPKKSDYRRFRIKTVRAANDIAMIKEVIQRRFGHPEWPYPDLILIDGGKAHLSAARQIANSKSQIIRNERRFAISDWPFAIVALAKREEEIYTEYSDKPLKINRLPQSLRLTFQRIRDEAHRFAIFYYRYLHRKTTKNP